MNFYIFHKYIQLLQYMRTRLPAIICHWYLHCTTAVRAVYYLFNRGVRRSSSRSPSRVGVRMGIEVARGANSPRAGEYFRILC